MASLVFRIRRKYFDAIVRGDKRTEWRKASSYWINRIAGKGLELDTAVFICGKKVHRRRIVGITFLPTPTWFSEQGKKDVNTPDCFAIELGSEIKEGSQ